MSPAPHASDTGVTERDLLEKILALPPERVAEVEDFVDFLRDREDQDRIVASAQRLSQPAFDAVWDNPDDAEYDRL